MIEINQQLPFDANFTISQAIKKLCLQNDIKTYLIIEEVFKTAWTQGQQEVIDSILQ